MHRMSNFSRTTVSLPNDLKEYLERNGVNVSKLLQDAITARMQRDILPDWYYSDELPRKEELMSFVRILEDNEKNVRALQFYYHRLTTDFSQEDPKVQSLAAFIRDLANVNHPEYSTTVRKALEHDAEISDWIFGDSGLLFRKVKLESDIVKLEEKKQLITSGLNDQIKKLNREISDLKKGDAYYRDEVRKAEEELENINGEKYRIELKMGEYKSMEKLIKENDKLKSEISGLGDRIKEISGEYQGKIDSITAELASSREAYRKLSTGFTSLDRSSVTYLFKAMTKKMKSIHTMFYASCKVMENETLIKVPWIVDIPKTER